MEQEQYPGKLHTFEEFIDWHDRIQYVENPRKLANYNCCAAIIKTMAQEYEEIKFGSHSIEGGVEFTLHLNTVSYLPDFNVLLGELISRCQMFSVSPDPEEPSEILLSLDFFTCDHIVDGRLLLDL